MVICIFNFLNNLVINILWECIQKMLDGEKKHCLNGFYSLSDRQLKQGMSDIQEGAC